MLELRPYQKECVDIVNALPDHSRAIVAMATGLGKTVTFSRFDRRGGRMLILSHRDELVRQPEKYFPGCRYEVEKADEYASFESDIVSASVQTLSRDSRLKRWPKDFFSIIVIDEAHHAAAPTYKKIINYFGKSAKLLIGVTATPKRGDNVRLDDVFDKICFNRDIMFGIRNGYLSPIKTRMIFVSNVSLDSVSLTAGDFNQGQLAALLEQNQAVFDCVTETFFRYAYSQNRHTIIYCLTVKSCHKIAENLRARMPEEERDSVQIITGATEPLERQIIEDGFRSGKVRVLVNCMVLTEGADFPNCDCILILRPTLNASLFTQIVGRGTRLYDGKDYCLIIDIVPASRRHLCTAFSLAGVDYKDADKKQRKKIESGELIDVFEEVDKINEERSRANAPFRFFEVEYDLLAETVENARTMIQAGVQNGDLGNAIAEKLFDEANSSELDFGSLRYMLRSNDEQKYMIKASQTEAFWISAPDVLNKVTVTAKLNGKDYQSEEPMAFSDAVSSITSWLSQYRGSPSYSFYWNDGIVEAWKGLPATDAQASYVNNLVKKLNLDNPSERSLVENKFEASAAIDYLTDLTGNVKKLQEIKRILALKDKGEAPPQIPDEIVYAPLKDVVPTAKPDKRKRLKIYITFSYGYPNGSAPASESQLQFARKLWDQLCAFGYVADCDADTYLQPTATKRQMGCYISLLREIVNELPHLTNYGKTLGGLKNAFETARGASSDTFYKVALTVGAKI